MSPLASSLRRAPSARPRLGSPPRLSALESAPWGPPFPQLVLPMLTAKPPSSWTERRMVRLTLCSGASAILASHAVSGRAVRVARRSLAAEAGHVRRSMRGRFRTPSSPIIDPVFSGRFLLISVVSVNSCVVVVYGCMTYVTCRNRFYFQQRACLTRANVAFGTLARRKRFRVIAPVNEGHQDRGSHAAVCLCSSGLDGSAAGNAWLLRSFAAVETSFASFSSTGSN